MSDYLIQGETLTAIGDAIRAKTGSSAQLTPVQMATEIAGIQTGGSVKITTGTYAVEEETTLPISSSSNDVITIEHNLGVVPDIFLFFIGFTIVGYFQGVLGFIYIMNGTKEQYRGNRFCICGGGSTISALTKYDIAVQNVLTTNTAKLYLDPNIKESDRHLNATQYEWIAIKYK